MLLKMLHRGLALLCALPLATGALRTQDHLLLGEPTNIAPLPGFAGDKAVSVQAVCGVHGAPKKVKCTTPQPVHGISPRWSNVSAPLFDLRSHKAAKDGCKAPADSALGEGLVALVSNGGCSLGQKARRAHAAGFLGLLVVDGPAKHKRKGKVAERKMHLPIPVAMLSKGAAKTLLSYAQPMQLPGARATPGPNVSLALKALAKDASTYWKTPTTLYQEGMKLLTQARQLRDDTGDWLALPDDAPPLPVPAAALELYRRAISAFRLSVKIEPRAHVAQHELSNALLELSALMPRRDAAAAAEALREAEQIASRLVGFNATGVELTYASRCGADAKQAQEQEQEGALVGGGKLRVVAVATDPRPQLTALIQTVENAGYELEVIGMGTTYPGLGLKVMSMAEWLPTVPDEDYVLMVDAYDVLFLADAKELLARFHSFCAPLVFGAETRCHPDTALALVHPQRRSGAAALQPFHYLNSGTYMGRASHVKRMFRQIFEDLRDHYSWGGADYRQVNDQRWFMRHWFLHHEDVVLDVHGEIFHTLHQVPYEGFGEEGPQGSFLSNVTKTRPCVVHGNGKDGKETINKFIKRFRKSGWIPPPPPGKL